MVWNRVSPRDINEKVTKGIKKARLDIEYL